MSYGTLDQLSTVHGGAARTGPDITRSPPSAASGDRPANLT
jgi:hypothetical protein